MADAPREYPTRPVPAAAGVILRENEVLLVKRGSRPRRGIWTFPGGVVRAGERLRDAVKREVREETGVEVEPVAPVALAERVHRDEGGKVRYHYLILNYLCLFKSGEPAPAADAQECSFVPTDRLPALDPTGALMKVVDAAQKAIRGEDAALVLI